MKGIAAEDIQRLIETNHDQSVDSANAVNNDEERASFEYTQGRLRERRVMYLQAVLLVRKEGAETTGAQARLHHAVDAAMAQYSFARTRTRADLLELDPSAPKPDLVEQARLEGEWEQAFGVAPSLITKNGAAQQLARLETCCGLVALSAPLAAHAATAKLKALVEVAIEAQAKRSAEGKEDSEAMRALWAAREELDAAHKAHRLQVESLLVGQRRPERLGAFIKAEDPAYKARRRAQAPIEQDPDLEILAPELSDPT